MKKQILLFLICIFISNHTVFAIACSTGTSTTPSGSINDGFASRLVTVGAQTSTSATGSPICTGTANGMRTQYLFLASELASAGLVAGPITSLSFNIATGGSSSVPNFTVSMGSLAFTSLITTYDATATNVVFNSASMPAPVSSGAWKINFTTPYAWNGVSNILIDICHGVPSPAGITPIVSLSSTGAGASNVRCNQGFGATACALATSGAGTSNNRPVIIFGQEPDYDNFAGCNQLISPGPGFNSITLNFTEFITESNFDYVTIYDGPTTSSPVLAQYSGNLTANLPSITSTTNQMLVRFTTNNSITAAGWSANYVSNIYCGGTTVFTAPSGVFSDGSTSGLYLNNTDCSWFINPGANISSITLSFSAFALEFNGGPPNDYVKVYSGSSAILANLLNTYSGTTVPSSVTYNFNQIFVVFHSDFSVVAQGFDASYQAHYCNTLTTFTTPSGSFSDGSGPTNNYLDNTNCTWFINPVLGPLNTVGLTFTPPFITETGIDFVNIYNGPNNASPLLASYSGGALPAAVHSTNGNPMFVEFITDGSITKVGWNANYVVNCTPTVTISGNSTICQGTLATFTTALQNQGTVTAVEWFKNAVSQGISVSYSSAALVNGDVITAKLTSNAPCAFPLTVTSNAITMTVYDRPVISITSLPDPPEVCDGDPIILTASGAGPGGSYAWLNYPLPSIPGAVYTYIPTATETDSVIGTDNHGCKDTATILVTVNPLPDPVITSNTGSFLFCNHSAIILDASSNGPFSGYLWSIGATVQAIQVNSGAAYTVTVTDANGCTASTSETTVRLTSPPARPGPISGPVYGRCNTSGNVYSIALVPFASSYAWTVTNGIIVSGQGTESITVDYLGFTTSTITVKAVNACGNSSSRTLKIYPKPSAPITINGNKNGVCKSTGEVYDVDPIDGATSYDWTIPSSGVTLVSGQGTDAITVDFLTGFSSGTICCRATNACGSSAYTCISIKAKPMKPIIIYGPTGPCANSVGNIYWTPGVYGTTTYIWDVPHGATITSGAGTPSITVTMGTHAGQVEVWAKNDCGTSADYDLNIVIPCRDADDLSSGEINAYPNPVRGLLNLSISSEVNQKCTVKLIDIIGKQMMIDVLELAKGENLNTYNLSDFAKGLYFIVIQREGMTAQTIRVVVE